MTRCDNFLSAMATRCRWKLCKKCRLDWQTVKQQAATEAAQRKSGEEALLGRENTELEAEFEDMLTEIEIHGIIFARSRCHGGNEEILDQDTESRCRCSGCAKPAPSIAESAERVQRRRQCREMNPGSSESFDISAPHHRASPGW